jgi:hypothetical protein
MPLVVEACVAERSGATGANAGSGRDGLIPESRGVASGGQSELSAVLAAESGRYTRDEPAPADARRGAAFGRRPSEADFDVIDVVVAIAQELGATPAAVALSWVQGRPGVTSTLIGPRRLDHLEANLTALELTLTADQRGRLDAASEPTLNFPAALNRDVAPMLQYAGATVNGQPTEVYPPLLQSPERY